jgi:uncharacterized alpha-E superfamily protein
MANNSANETRPLLSRVADSVYWMSRYIERAENIARVIEVNLHLQLDLPSTASNLWQALIDTSGETAVFGEKYGPATQAKVVKFLAQDASNPNSIFTCVRAARENARSVRETISSEMWEQVNSMYLQMQGQWNTLDSANLPELFRSIRLASHMFQGITDATMSHDEAWHFTCLGRQMERADKTSRLLDVKYFMLLPSASSVGTPYDDLHWAAVLKSVSGFEMYRKQHGRIAPKTIVEFLVLDREFPRSIHHTVGGADECVHAITGTPRGSFQYRSEQGLGMLKAELDFTSVDRIIRDGLHEYLDGLQVKMNAIGDALLADFFATSPVLEAASSATTS